jgi:hypothetical protein
VKPKPQISVHEMLALGDKLPASFLPYDTYTHVTAGFVALAVGDEFIALPLSALAKASLREGSKSIALEFGSVLVRIEGRSLGELFECILLGQVRVIRTGRHPSCSVDCIRLSETLSLQ